MWLMQANRECFILPGKGGMGHDNRHIRKIHRHVVQIHRIRVFKMYATTATHTSADTSMPCVEDCWKTGLGDYLVEDIGAPLIWVKFLYGWVKFKSSHPELLDEAASLSRSHFPLRRIDTGKWNKYIGILSSNFGHFFIRNSYYSGSRLHVDRENDACHLSFPVIRCYFSNSGVWSFVLKI